MFKKIHINIPVSSWGGRAALALLLSFIVFWTIALYLRLQNFGYYDWDLAYFCQSMWQLGHGSQFSSLLEKNFLGNHSNFIGFLIVPIYKILPHPLTLLFIKILSVAVAGWGIFRVAVRELGEGQALCIMALFFFYAPNIFGILYEFDMEALAPGILTMAYYFYYERRWKPFMALIIAAVLIKENIALVVTMFGVHGLLTRDDKWKWGLAPLALGVGAFVFFVKVAIPFFSSGRVGGDHPYLFLYRDIAPSLGGVFINVIMHPVIFLKKFLDPVILTFIGDLFGPLLFLPFFGAGALFLSAPLFLQHLLSSARPQHEIYFSYAMTLAPFIFLGLIMALGIIRRRRPGWGPLIILLLFAMSLLTLKDQWLTISGCYAPENTLSWNDARRELVARIPSGEPVMATFCFLPSLANRKELYAFHRVYITRANMRGKFFTIPPDVRWVILDRSDMFYQIQLGMNEAFVRERVDAFFKEGGWVQVAQRGPVYLFRRD